MISLNIGDVVHTLVDSHGIKANSIGVIKRIYSTFHADVRFPLDDKFLIVKLNLWNLKKIEQSKL